jgi:alkylation response protein AidB-like acyl-CoA dehydrogenase
VCLQDAYEHARRRETFGKKLIENQIIRAKFSAVGRQLDAAYALMENLVYISQASTRAGQDAYLGGQFANLKILAGQTLEKANREAQQVMGGLGYSKNGRGARVEQISRDVRVMVVGGGSEEILTDLSVNQETKAMAKLAARL